MSLPVPTPEARAAALIASRIARSERSAALAELKNGTVALADFLVTDNEVLKRTRVKQVILALPGVGKVRAARRKHGLGLVLINLIGIPVTNLSVNPARSTGPAIFVGGWAVRQLWLFWVAPLIGGALGGGVYRAILEE